MHSLAALALLATASASSLMTAGQRQAHMALEGIMGRQTRICSLVPAGANLCERSCGPGYIACISVPTCYNPSAGQTCCSNGKYCPSGYYCTDAGCCPNGRSLDSCGAKVTLSVIPPPSTTDTPSSSHTDSPSASTTTTAKPSTSTTTSKPSETTSKSSSSTPGPTTTTSKSATILPTSVIPTTSSRPSGTVTAGAARVAGNVAAGLGGVGAVLMLL